MTGSCSVGLNGSKGPDSGRHQGASRPGKASRKERLPLAGEVSYPAVLKTDKITAFNIWLKSNSTDLMVANS